VLQSEHRAQPDGPRKRLNAEALAAQILRSFDVGRGDNIIAKAIGQRADDLQVCSAGHCGQYGRAAGVGGVHVSRRQRRHQNRRLADENRVHGNTLFGKKSVVFADPERSHSSVHRSVPDNEISWR
jgi:hypothetical protein